MALRLEYIDKSESFPPFQPQKRLDTAIIRVNFLSEHWQYGSCGQPAKRLVLALKRDLL